MKMLKAAACAAITLMIPFNAYAAYIPEIGTVISTETSGIYLDGVYMGHDGKGAFIGENDTVMIPARYIDLYVNGSYEGSEIVWDDAKKEFSASVDADGKNKVITASAGEYFLTVGTEKIEQLAANVIIDGRIYIPLESAVKYGENENCKISYVGDSVITNTTKARETANFLFSEKIDDNQIEEYIKTNMDSSFSADKFTKRIIETEDKSDALKFIVYKYMIGDIETNFGYFAAVYADEAEISRIGDELYDLEKTCIVSANISEDELKKTALEDNNSDWEVLEQSVEKHFVPVIGKNVYDVSTVYKNGDIVSSVLSRYVIDENMQ